LWGGKREKRREREGGEGREKDRESVTKKPQNARCALLPHPTLTSTFYILHQKKLEEGEGGKGKKKKKKGKRGKGGKKKNRIL